MVIHRRARRANGTAETIGIDDLGRLSSVSNPLGVFTYAYQEPVSRHPASITVPGGPTTSFGWHPDAQDQRLREIWNQAPDGTTLSKFDYEYNSAGEIKQWQREGLTAGEATQYTFENDPAGELLSAVLKGVTTQTVAASYGYSYDGAGNRTGEAVNTAFTKETANALNQLVGRSSGSVLPIRGTTDEPVASVTVNGVPAKLGPGGTSFAGTANVTAVDNNPVVVTATDFGLPPNVTTKNYQVAVAAGGNSTLSYDDSGNLLSDGSRTYEWDAQDRLVAINVGTQRTEFGYDGLSRRITITEKAGATVTASKRFVMDGLTIAEERVNGDNTLNQRFYAAGVQVLTGVAPGRYLYTRDHLGSIREVWSLDTASLAARYDYDPFGRRTKLSGTYDADFGYTGLYFHAPSGLHLAYCRAYDAKLGRWLSRDPIEEEGGLNLYGYVENDPINGFDELGLFIVPGHNHILGSAFGNRLSREDLNIIKKASYDADFDKDGQLPSNACKHAMRQPGESVDHASKAYHKFVQDQLNKAVSLENSGRHSDAMQELGYGMHAIADSFSPAHRGFQEWDGLEGLGNWLKGAGHVCRELYPTPSQTRGAAEALQNYYGQFRNRTR